MRNAVMVGRGVVIAAVVVYLGVMVGCMFNTSAEPRQDVVLARRAPSGQGASRVAGLPFRGIAIQIQRADWLETEYRKCVDEIADTGADTVMIVVDARMEHGGSNRIYLDMRTTPTPEHLGSLITYAKKEKNLRVVLMPIVLLDSPRSVREWRGTINPENWPEWWTSYRGMMHHYAWIAEAYKADVLVVGSELVSTENKAAEWRETIEVVRKTFRGLITYSANWDHYKDIPFWEDLDLIGMNSYYKLGEDRNVSVKEITQRWKDIQKGLLNFQREKGKPLVLLEAGWHSVANSADEPWDYTKETIPIDLDLQKRLYEGFFQAWYGTKGFGGFMLWEWAPNGGGPENRGYTPKNKPAEKVLREWMKKDRWEVQ